MLKLHFLPVILTPLLGTWEKFFKIFTDCIDTNANKLPYQALTKFTYNDRNNIDNYKKIIDLLIFEYIFIEYMLKYRIGAK